MWWGGETQVDVHPMPLSNLTSQCLFAAYLVRFADSGEGASGDSGGEGWGNGGLASGGLSRIGGG